MGIFNRKKDFIDLTEYHQRQQRKAVKPETPAEENIAPFGFFGAMPTTSEQTESTDFGPESDSEDKRRKLAKRLKDMTEKIEDFSNQIYHLQQRVELLERKLRVNDF